MQLMLDHVSLLVSDVQKSASFYRDVVGLQILRTSGSPVTGIWMGIDSDILHLNERAGATFSLPKDVHFALRTTSFDAVVERFNELAIMYFDWPGNERAIGQHPLGFRQIYLIDPDGYWVEINDVTRPDQPVA